MRSLTSLSDPSGPGGPPGLQDLVRRGRAVAWRLRFVAAGLAGLVALRLLVPAVVGAFQPTVPGVALTHAVQAGQVLAPADVKAVKVARGVAPRGLMTDPAAAVGGRAVAALPAGTALTPELLTAQAPVATAPPGRVAVPVRLSDPAVAALLRPGTRIDVMASPGQTGSGEIAPAHRLAAAAQVLDVPARATTPAPESARGNSGSGTGDNSARSNGSTGGNTGSSGSDGLVILALTEQEAALVGGAAAWAVVTAVIVAAPE
ncbi:MAG: SAF domain-containing protein [Bifidobacteriaceae bacterium]|jgi:Flp pilus assembly protein CpaB|nr:SAF domain-containing protein [Bifidobacteriaceae bacterium]